MERDYMLDNVFRAYFAGAELPALDLTAAKQALRAERVRQKRRRGVAIGLVSAAACLLVAVVLCINLLPALFVHTYTIAEAEHHTADYTSLREDYADVMQKFSHFSLSSNASAEYTVYEVEGREVLLQADLRMVSGGTRISGSVYVDLSDGAYVAEELRSYAELEEGASYRYTTEYINGEYVSRAYYEGDRIYCVDLSSQRSNALEYLMTYLMR